MDAKDLRSRGDSDLAEKLLAEPLVTRLIERLEREQHGPKGVRRHLLATSLRLTEQMMPDVHEIVRDCRARLGIEIPLEVYVYPDTRFNAACIKPEDGRLFIMLSSGLLEAFPAGERRFVIGHELGHHLFGHHDIPIGYVLGGSEPPPPDLALRLFAWSRYAEISADRAGAFCAGDPDDVARALFRLASGLRPEALQRTLCAELLRKLQAQRHLPAQVEGAARNRFLVRNGIMRLQKQRDRELRRRDTRAAEFLAVQRDEVLVSEPLRPVAREQSVEGLLADVLAERVIRPEQIPLRLATT